ncbi:hypothetical protein GLOIN_2v1730649 [Rhizophagus clarus]|uniref:Uncharacterized protein n=1 Tax=Rhizophagus clarus TaxID=94130 RepID=A0A8H3KSH4_9GLOM|nr:hypothetical protein GLOIN_2v1730649 [Rhizophagus clarus]
MRSIDINCLILGKIFRRIIFIKIKENEPIAMKYYHILKSERISSQIILHIFVKIEVIIFNCIISDTYSIEISVE